MECHDSSVFLVRKLPLSINQSKWQSAQLKTAQKITILLLYLVNCCLLQCSTGPERLRGQ